MCLKAYRITNAYPHGEQFGLTAQIRRAAVSVGANIVEGAKRRSQRESSRFLNIAEGSAAETAYLLRLAADLGHGEPAADAAAEFERLERMICSLRKRVDAGRR